MKSKPVALAAVLAVMAGAVAAPALAQPYDDGYDGPVAESYDEGYDDGAYADDRGYDDDRAYDERRGYDDRSYDDRYDRGGYERYDRYDDYRTRRWSRYDGRGYHPSCRQQRRDRAGAGAVIGGIAGAVIGSNMADRNVRGEGAAIGAVAGALVGSQVGRATADCDAYGYYYSYEQTRPYRISSRWRGDRRYADYGRRGCRLALVERYHGRAEYVPVCPDRYGRYRIMD